MVLLYIDGVEVSAVKAKEEYQKAIEAFFNCYELMTDKEKESYSCQAWYYWKTKATSETSRDMVHSISAILEHGGIEVFIEN